MEADYREAEWSSLLGIDDALARVLERVRAGGGEEVAVAAAAGRVLAEDARAVVDLPPFASSAMDGYAVRAADTPGTLPVVGQSAAGAPSPASAASRARPMVDLDRRASCPRAPTRSCRSRRRASATRMSAPRRRSPPEHTSGRAAAMSAAGDVVGRRGQVLGPRSSARSRPRASRRSRCARRPRVAVLATGTELRAPGEPLGPGRDLRVEHASLLAAQVESAGARGRACSRPVADDRGRDARRARARARRRRADHLGRRLRRAARPRTRGRCRSSASRRCSGGSPSSPASRSRSRRAATTLVFGLPGNPVSSLVGFELFVRPALLALQGRARAAARVPAGRASADLSRNEARDELVRARIRVEPEGVVLEPLTGQESHMIARAFAARRARARSTRRRRRDGRRAGQLPAAVAAACR